MMHACRALGAFAVALLLSSGGALLATPQKPPKSPVPPEPPAGRVVEHDAEIDVDEDGPDIVRVTTGPRAFLGVRLVDLTPELREHFAAPRDAGVMIAFVEADSPAAKAGLKVGDIVSKADGKPVVRASDLSRAVRRKDDGEKISLAVTREKAAQTIDVTVSGPKRGHREAWVGEWGAPHTWHFSMPEFDRGRFDAQMERLQRKLADLERKLKEMEGRLRAK